MFQAVSSSQNIRNRKFIFAVCGAGIFLAVSAFITFCEGGSIASIFPTWNDEGGYYRQLLSMVEYGHPLGYNGYNGGHAIIGNFGFHGMFILLPYYLWAKIFGLSYVTIGVCNIFLVTSAVFLFFMCIDCSLYKFIAYLGCIMTPMLVYYTATGMVEAENYFISIALSAFLIRLQREKNKRIIIAAWVVTILGILCKVTWAGMVFPLAFLLQKKERKLKYRLLIAFLSMVIFMGVGYFIFSRFSSPYFSSVLSDYIEVYKQSGIKETAVYVARTVYHNLGKTFAAINTQSYSLWFKVSALITWLVFLLGLLSILYSVIRKKMAFFWPGFIIGAYMGGVALMYTGGPVAIRTLYPAVVISMLLLADLYVDRQAAASVGTVFLLMTVCLGVLKKYEPREFYDQENRAYLEKINDFYKDLLKVKENEDGWANTVAVHLGDMPDFYYTMVYPAGMANNSYNYMPEQIEKTVFPRYALAISRNTDWYNLLVEDGFVEKGANEDVIVLERVG